MSDEFGDILDPYKRLKIPLGFKASRTYHQVTHNPSSAKPGETLYVRIPKLEKNTIIVPRTFCLTFDLELSGDAGNYIVNNIKNIVKHLTFNIGDNEILRLNRHDLYSSYKDLFLSSDERSNKIFEGIQSENLRKSRIKPQSSSKSADAKDASLATIFSNRYRLFFNVIDFLKTPIYPFCISQDILITITLNDVSHLLVATVAKDYNYEIKNIHMEYETVTSKLYADIIREAYQVGTTILCTNVVLFREEYIKKADTIFNVNINVPRSSLKGILMLFREDLTPATHDSELFYNPMIKEIKITVEGLPNLVYSQDYKAQQQYSEICRYFKKSNPYVTLANFYADNKFGLFIDFRSNADDQLHGSGLKIVNSKDGIQLQITKSNTGASGNIMAFTYLISDSQFNIIDCLIRDFVN